jgi:uncharacterized membrane protein YjgN (DUF898 family)
MCSNIVIVVVAWILGLPLSFVAIDWIHGTSGVFTEHEAKYGKHGVKATLILTALWPLYAVFFSIVMIHFFVFVIRRGRKA